MNYSIGVTKIHAKHSINVNTIHTYQIHRYKHIIKFVENHKELNIIKVNSIMNRLEAYTFYINIVTIIHITTLMQYTDDN